MRHASENLDGSDKESASMLLTSMAWWTSVAARMSALVLAHPAKLYALLNVANEMWAGRSGAVGDAPSPIGKPGWARACSPRCKMAAFLRTCPGNLDNNPTVQVECQLWSKRQAAQQVTKTRTLFGLRKNKFSGKSIWAYLRSK